MRTSPPAVPAARHRDVSIEGMPRGGEFDRAVPGNAATLGAAQARDEAVWPGLRDRTAPLAGET